MELINLSINIVLTIVALPLTLAIVIARKAVAQAIYIEKLM